MTGFKFSTSIGNPKPAKQLLFIYRYYIPFSVIIDLFQRECDVEGIRWKEANLVACMAEVSKTAK